MCSSNFSFSTLLHNEKSHYRTLKLSQNASHQEVRQAFIKQAKKYHPDLTGGKSDEKFKRIYEAYQVLSNAERRLEYDASIGIFHP